MKFITLALVLSSFSSFAATLHSAKLDAAKKNILVDVSYGGGCKKHTFRDRGTNSDSESSEFMSGKSSSATVVLP